MIPPPQKTSAIPASDEETFRVFAAALVRIARRVALERASPRSARAIIGHEKGNAV